MGLWRLALTGRCGATPWSEWLTRPRTCGWGVEFERDVKEGSGAAFAVEKVLCRGGLGFHARGKCKGMRVAVALGTLVCTIAIRNAAVQGFFAPAPQTALKMCSIQRDDQSPSYNICICMFTVAAHVDTPSSATCRHFV